MNHWFSGHPAGACGVALVLLRVAAALTLAAGWFYVNANTSHWVNANTSHWWLPIVFGPPAVLLFLGLGTRIAALVCAIVPVCVGIYMGGWGGAILGFDALNFVAIALLGAGAYSIDARLFGRRVIKLDS